MAAMKPRMTPARRRLAGLLLLLAAGLGAERLFGAVAENEDALSSSAPQAPAAAGGAAGEAGSLRATRPPGVLQSSTQSPAPGTELHLDRLRARAAAAAAGPATGAETVALFEPQSWQPPPEKPKPPPPPPAPEAPAFPYAYLGGLTEDGVRTGFFAKGERVLPLRGGDTVDGNFRVEQITESQMKLTYLPLGTESTVALGAAR
jgi:hypothetical protein